jgi:hypothetical protein
MGNNRWHDGWVLGTCALCLLLAAGPGRAEGKKPAGALPADLARVPQKAMTLLSVNVAEVWEHKGLARLRAKMPREVAEVNGEVEKAIGVPLADIERLSLVGVPQGRAPFLFFVRTRKPYNARKLRAMLGGAAEEVKVGKEVYQLGKRGRALFVIDGRTFVVGRELEVRWLLENPKARGPGPLAGAVREAAGKHAVVLAVNTGTFPPEVKASPEVVPFLPLFEAELWTARVDVGEHITASVQVSFPENKKAKEGAKALQALVGLAVKGLEQVGKGLAREPGETKSLVALLEKGRATLGDVKVRRKGTVIEARASLKVDLAGLAPALTALTQRVRTAAARAQSSNNLRQMAIAMHNYHDVHGAFPPPAVYDKEGKPILSWRVLLLPYMEQIDMYREFHLNEPWDSPHNKKLLARMPRVFAAPTGKGVKEHKTFYQAIVGKGTVWDSKRGVRIQDIAVTDGTSHTIMFVEAGKPVPWTKPEDVAIDAKKKLPRLGGIFPDGFHAAFCDGTVRFLPAKVKEATLRLLFLRANGIPRPGDLK